MVIVGISRLDQTGGCSKLGKTDHCGSGKHSDKNSTPFDVHQEVNLEHLRGHEKPVWDGTEEEQLEWALAESAKSAEKESRAKLKECLKEQNENKPECSGKSKAMNEDTAHSFEDEDFNLASDVSDKDLENAAQESEPDDANGLKGGGPISATVDITDDLDISVIHNTSRDRNTSIDSSVEKSASRGTVLKNSPILMVKRPNGYTMRKRKLQDKIHTNKTPTLGRFDGDLFQDSVKENKISSSNASSNERPRGNLYSNAFRDEDMAKAINMSLQEDQVR